MIPCKDFHSPSTNLRMNEHFDVIIIGSGAGGGTLALKLAPSGKRILILERGGHLAREKQNWDTTEVFVKNRYVSKDTWYDQDGKPFQPGVHYFVGGATKMYGAALFRLRQGDFTAHRTADGQTPDWPIRYEDLEPYYTQAEKLYNVHGQHGDDPTDPPASAPYPFPPISHEPRVQELADGLKRAGFHPAYAPTGILLNEADAPNSRCIRCDTCDGFPCLIHAKGDAEVIAVRPALQFPNVTLLTQAQVLKLETSASGREVTKVIVERDGQRQEYCGSIVVVSCGAANSARLLLMSANLDMHPHLIPNNVYLGKQIPIAGVGHQSGTCRFGADPDSSVLDVNCKAHELDNLYVVDTSFFPSIGAVNPSLTAIANALRVGDHLLERLHGTTRPALASPSNGTIQNTGSAACLARCKMMDVTGNSV